MFSFIKFPINIESAVYWTNLKIAKVNASG